MLRIAVQKNGRTTEKVLQILRSANFNFPEIDKRKLILAAENFPLEILLVRNSDIPMHIESGSCCGGFIGENVLKEKNSSLKILTKTEMLKCSLCLAIPNNSKFKKLKDFSNKKIATSYPNATKKFFAEKNIKIKIIPLSGSVEIAPEIEIADAICDLVSTGTTLKKHKLKIFQKIFDSEIVFAAKKKSSEIEEFLFRINSILVAKNRKLLVFDAPKKNLSKILKFLPSAESPTISPLAESDWVSISTAVNDDDFWKIIPRLKKLNSKAILALPIEKIVL